MKAFRNVMGLIKKVASVVVLICILGIIVMMMAELINRNVFNHSFRFATELCGFLFMWMAFIGLIILFDENRMICLDMIYTRVPEKLQNIFWYITKIFSLILGVTMIFAYKSMYPVLSTSFFSTMQFLSKAWHFLPMAIAGGFMALDSVCMILERLTGSKKEVEGGEAA